MGIGGNQNSKGSFRSKDTILNKQTNFKTCLPTDLTVLGLADNIIYYSRVHGGKLGWISLPDNVLMREPGYLLKNVMLFELDTSFVTSL